MPTQVAGRRPGVKVLMLSMHEDPSYVRAALGAGRLRLRAEGRGVRGAGRCHPQGGRRPRRTSHPRWGPGWRFAPSPTMVTTCPSESEGAIVCWRGGTRTRRSRRGLFVSVRTVESHRAHILVEAAALDPRRTRQLRPGDRVAAARNGTLDRPHHRIPRLQAPDARRLEQPLGQTAPANAAVKSDKQQICVPGIGQTHDHRRRSRPSATTASRAGTPSLRSC